ncbi:MAG: hypothetical protein BGO43_08425 [Gammaproteobacteria bacterium 39-13]|nr:hypothetical protein [Gammaproteobacteria bacterium]OJV96476.1 MAG: hypothetical protein BGO43_08425 [Gammaproteobacteria bacterium 39-13]
MSDIIVVGAGPVGLWTAIQLKLHYPALQILMLEKHAKYQRSHTVKIDETSFKESHSNPEFQKLIAPLVGLVSTNVLEQTLKNYALKLGIEIRNEAVTSCQALVEKYPEAKIVIGADGSHSVVRKDIFEDKKNNKDLQYVAEIKYEVEGDSQPFSIWSQIYDPLLKVNHLVTEHVGKQNQNGKTPVTLRVFVDQNTFNGITQATFKDPYYWTKEDKNKMDPKLVQTIEIWLKEREKTFKDKIVKNSIKISSLKLNAYHSEKVVDQKYNKQWVLVGDAAFGVPYFRSLNNGLLCGSKLAEKISAFLQGQFDETQTSVLGFRWTKKISPLGSYSTFVSELAKYEKWIAALKTEGINVLSTQLSMVKTLLGIGIIGKQEEASVPGRMMVVGLTAIAGACLYSAMLSTKDKDEKKNFKTKTETPSSTKPKCK